MSPPSHIFRFQRLLDLAEQLADQSKQRLRTVHGQRRAKREEIQRLVAEMRGTSGPREAAGGLSCVQAWRSCSLYVHRLHELVGIEQQLLAGLDEDYQHALAAYLQRRRRHKSLELLRDRQETVWQQHVERRQQLEMDDFVLARSEPPPRDNE